MMEKQVWSPGPAAVLVLAGPWLLISVLSILAAFKSPGMWVALGVSLGIASFMVIWVVAFEVKVGEGRLEYSSLFGGKHVVALDQIQSAKMQVGGSKYRERFLPLIRLTIIPKPNSGLRPFHINLKVLERAAAKQIAEAISSDATSSTTATKPDTSIGIGDKSNTSDTS